MLRNLCKAFVGLGIVLGALGLGPGDADSALLLRANAQRVVRHELRDIRHAERTARHAERHHDRRVHREERHVRHEIRHANHVRDRIRDHRIR